MAETLLSEDGPVAPARPDPTIRPDPITDRPGPAAARTSPAAHLAGVFAAAAVDGERGVRLREVAFRTMIGIRTRLGTPAADALAGVLGTELPDRCGAVATGDRAAVLWLSPDEFLAVSDEDPATATGALRAALAAEPGSVIDLSANRTTFELTGPRARAVLEKGCALDLHPREFRTGSAYVTAIGSVPVLLWKTGAEAYAVLPRSSYADFLGRWLVDAMAEFKAAETP